MKRMNSTCYGMAFVLTAVLCMFATPFGFNALHAQEYTGPHEIKWVRVGDLRQWFTDAGMEVEYGLIPRAQDQAGHQTDELMWEAMYNRQDRSCARGLWIGATNFADPISGVTYPYKVVQAGPRFINTLTNFMPTVFKLNGQFNHPIVVVDGADATDNTLDDILDEVNPSQLADRIIVNETITNIGITVRRTIYAFSQQNHDNYHIYDFVFKNTGLVDKSGTQSNQTLNGVIFNFVNRYAPGWEAVIGAWSATGNLGWGRNTVSQVIGQNPNAADFEMRATYSWYSPHSLASGGYEADWGAPNFNRPNALGAPGFCGVVTLHADQSPSNPADDQAQPKGTQWWDSDDAIMNNINSYNPDQMILQYTAMSKEHPDQTQADIVGTSGTFADLWGSGIGGTVQMLAYGPYTMAPGDSIHIVMAEGVAGLDRAKSIEIGTKWFNNEAPFTMPDGKTSTDRNAYKRAWVWTAEDSVKTMFRRAIKVYNDNYVIPQPPPPPETFTVSSMGDRISLTWASNADSWPNFNGYQVYRAISRPDTIYDLIFSCDKNDVVHQYDDIQASRGFNYYYYVVSKDDGSTNDVNPGQPLVSSKYYTVTNEAAYLRRTPKDNMDEIRVVPNPFHINARSVQFDADRIAFFGLPPKCTIKIYTERGDLIETLNHINLTGDELWESVTSSRQVIVSGMYIAVFETPDGKKAFRKIVIIR